MIEISKVERPFLLKFARDNGYKGTMEQLTKNPILIEDFKSNFQLGGVVGIDDLLQKAKTYVNPKNWEVTDYSDKFPDKDKAFAAARKAGEKEYLYKGVRYTTNYKGTPQQQLKETGITDDRLGVKNSRSDKAYNSVKPSVYLSKEDVNQQLINYFNSKNRFDNTEINKLRKQYTEEGSKENYDIKKIKEIEKKMFSYEPAFHGEDDVYSEDAWKIYLGKPQTKNTFSISNYKPSLSKENNINYYSLPNDFKQELFDLYNNGQIKKGINNEFSFSNIFDEVSSRARVLGNFTVDEGKDEKGSYISYYDKYDLNPNLPVIGNVLGLENFVGKPFEIYDRIYYNDYGDGQKKRMYYSDKELSELDLNKKNFDTLALQRELANRGYNLPKSTKADGTFDGILGDETIKALEKYKQQKGFQFGGVVASNNSQVVGVEKMQVGGDVKPTIYVDPNDPKGRERYQAYNDSLDLYNLYKYQESITGNTGKSADFNAKTLNSSDIHKDAREALGFNFWGGAPVSHKQVTDYERQTGKSGYLNTDTEEYKKLNNFNRNNNITIIKRGSPEFYHKSIEPTSNYKSQKGAANFIYKKPTQPVKYKPNPEGTEKSDKNNSNFTSTPTPYGNRLLEIPKGEKESDYEIKTYYNSISGNNDWTYVKKKLPNPEIVAKQQQLIDAGFNIGEADGVWGKKSKEAWEQYQQTLNQKIEQPKNFVEKPQPLPQTPKLKEGERTAPAPNLPNIDVIYVNNKPTFYQNKEGKRIPYGTRPNAQGILSFQVGGRVSLSSIFDNGGEVKRGTKEYKEAYEKGQVVRQTEDGTLIAPQLREFVFEDTDERIKNAVRGNQKNFLSNVLEFANQPQKQMVGKLTGKNQTPSEAVGFNNPNSWELTAEGLKAALQDVFDFGLDAVTDPTNLVGAGLLKQGLKGVAKKVPKSINKDNVGKSFKSEIDWGKWNKEIPKPTSSIDDVEKMGFDGNFITRPLTPFTKNELTKGKQLYRKIGGKKGLEDLISKKGSQAPSPMKMKSGVTIDTPFFGIGSKPNENYSGIFAIEHPLPSKSKYDWTSRAGGVENWGSSPIDPQTGGYVKNIPLEDLEVYRKKWFSNNYKKLDKNNLQKELKSANIQELSEKLYKWGIRGYLADQIINDGDLTGGNALKIIDNYLEDNNKISEEKPQFQKGGRVKLSSIFDNGGEVKRGTKEYKEAYEKGQVVRQKEDGTLIAPQLREFVFEDTDDRVKNAVRGATGDFAKDYIAPTAKMAASIANPVMGVGISAIDIANALYEGQYGTALLGAGAEALPYGVGKASKYVGKPLLEMIRKGVKNVEIPKSISKKTQNDINLTLPQISFNNNIEREILDIGEFSNYNNLIERNILNNLTERNILQKTTKVLQTPKREVILPLLKAHQTGKLNLKDIYYSSQNNIKGDSWQHAFFNMSPTQVSNTINRIIEGIPEGGRFSEKSLSSDSFRLLLPKASAKQKDFKVIVTGSYNRLNNFGNKGKEIEKLYGSEKGKEEIIKTLNAYIERYNRNTNGKIPKAKIINNEVYVPNLIFEKKGGSLSSKIKRHKDITVLGAGTTVAALPFPFLYDSIKNEDNKEKVEHETMEEVIEKIFNSETNESQISEEKPQFQKGGRVKLSSIFNEKVKLTL